MSSNDDDTETREREVDDILGLIDVLNEHEARSILRWLATNDEEVDPSMLSKILRTVRMTFLNDDRESNYGINTLVDFSNTSSAKVKWLQIQRAQVSRSYEEVRNKPRHVRGPRISSSDLW